MFASPQCIEINFALTRIVHVVGVEFTPLGSQTIWQVVEKNARATLWGSLGPLA